MTRTAIAIGIGLVLLASLIMKLVNRRRYTEPAMKEPEDRM